MSEIGTDTSRFPTANHLATWAGVAPGSNESVEKCRSCKTRKGNPPLRAALNQSAHAAVHTKNIYLTSPVSALGRTPRGKKAIVAVEHSILVIAYHLIDRNEPYRDLGGDYLEKRRPEAKTKRLVKRLEQMGFQVTLQPTTASPVA